MLAGFVAVASALVAVPLAATWIMFRSLGIEAVTPAGEAYEREARLRAEPARRLAQAASFPAFAGLTYADPAAEPAREAASVAEAAPPIVVAAAAPDLAPPSASSVAPPRRPSASAPPPIVAPRVAVPRIIAAPAPVASPPPEERSVVQKLFAALTPSTEPREDDVTSSVTAYANPDLPRDDKHRIAVYDIVSHTVHMPNGERLEAHSGLGPAFDNPSFTHVRMRGPTPPQTYRLSMRESLFHGVAAIRLNPIGEETMHGRDGMLAHTYMLGPRGESNGCVSFQDYSKFLAAFRRGDVTHLIVVARMTGSPASVVAAKRAGIRTASGSAPIRR